MNGEVAKECLRQITMPVFSHTRVRQGGCKANVVLETSAAPRNADKKGVDIYVFTGWSV